MANKKKEFDESKTGQAHKKESTPKKNISSSKTVKSEAHRSEKRKADTMPEHNADKEVGGKKRRKGGIPANSVLHQIIPIALLGLCAVCGICIYTGIPMGFLGKWINLFFFGFLGCGAYFVPPMMLLAALFWRRDAAQYAWLKKIIFGTFSLVVIAVLFYTFGVPAESRNAWGEFWSMGCGKIGGGVLGNAIGFVLNFCVAKTGTVIFAILALLISAILFFNLKPNEMIASAVAYFRRTAQARAEQKKKAAEERAAKELLNKREARAHDETDFYEKKSVPTAVNKRNGSEPVRMERTDNAFMIKGEQVASRTPVSRQFYDADSDTVVFGEQTTIDDAEKRADEPRKRPAFDDEAFFTHEERASDFPVYYGDKEDKKQGSARTLADNVAEKSSYMNDEDDVTKIEVVANRPIPSKRPAETFASYEEPVTEQDEESAVIVEEVLDEVSEDGEALQDIAEADTEVEEADGEGLVINKAHTIEHIGAEKFSDEAEAHFKKSDTFFYSFPPLSLLHEDEETNQEDSDQEIADKAKRLIGTLESFGVQAKISCVSRGPRLTRYELVPEVGVRIRSIENLVDEIAMNLEAVSVRIEAPIPGKAAIGVEVPNVKYSTVRLRGLLDTDKFRDAPGKTTVCLGVDVVGVPVFADLDKMPHLLVAGATGMGKSVCINSILVSLLYKARPDEVKLILIDPKKVEFKAYYNIPHLLVPVVTEAQKAAGSLAWAVGEMERRYDIIERTGVRNIKAYNATLADHPEREKIPQIVIVIDELHDLMIQARDAVEDSIARIAAKARAAGILLIIGTQRPSVNVITGVIKANIPSRIAFHVASQVDSRTILDAVGAEKLLNNGDMLFLSPGMQMMTPKRVQGAFLDDDEVTRVAEYLRKNSSGVRYDEAIMADMDRESEKYNKDKKPSGDISMGDDGDGGEDDILYRAIEVALENGKISTSLLQRKLSLGFGKAARMIDRMQEMGIVSAPNGQKPRDVLITMDEYRAMRLKNDR